MRKTACAGIVAAFSIIGVSKVEAAAPEIGAAGGLFIGAIACGPTAAALGEAFSAEVKAVVDTTETGSVSKPKHQNPRGGDR